MFWGVVGVDSRLAAFLASSPIPGHEAKPTGRVWVCVFGTLGSRLLGPVCKQRCWSFSLAHALRCKDGEIKEVLVLDLKFSPSRTYDSQIDHSQKLPFWIARSRSMLNRDPRSSRSSDSPAKMIRSSGFRVQRFRGSGVQGLGCSTKQLHGNCVPVLSRLLAFGAWMGSVCRDDLGRLSDVQDL